MRKTVGSHGKTSPKPNNLTSSTSSFRPRNTSLLGQIHSPDLPPYWPSRPQQCRSSQICSKLEGPNLTAKRPENRPKHPKPKPRNESNLPISEQNPHSIFLAG